MGNISHTFSAAPIANSHRFRWISKIAVMAEVPETTCDKSGDRELRLENSRSAIGSSAVIPAAISGLLIVGSLSWLIVNPPPSESRLPALAVLMIIGFASFLWFAGSRPHGPVKSARPQPRHSKSPLLRMEPKEGRAATLNAIQIKREPRVLDYRTPQVTNPVNETFTLLGLGSSINLATAVMLVASIACASNVLFCLAVFASPELGDAPIGAFYCIVWLCAGVPSAIIGLIAFVLSEKPNRSWAPFGLFLVTILVNIFTALQAGMGSGDTRSNRV
jgi:hypothetical protein